ncbi:glycosyltransferase [Sphingomonas sp. Leaf33]|uniref:glycosyltransferase n=1 Tax=Sphingomonas sp. Leaf33 TaxID=1736215 RepID=UPI0019105EAD|nr:glycosyltransferase [Sphingomonas sp. Leaf33]
MANILRSIKRVVGPLNPRKRRARAERKRAYDAMRAFVVTEENRREGIFDGDWYGTRYPDILAEGFDPYHHYITHGHRESRDPGPNFDTNFYLRTYPDVVAAGLNPLIHYLDSGRAEGRAANPHQLPTAPVRHGRSDADLRHVIVKEMGFVPGHEACVFVTHAPSGRLKPHVLPHMQLLRDCGIAVLLVAVVDRPLELLDAERDVASGIIVRDNAGYDFGAWAHAFRLVPALYGASLLVITNDSIIPVGDAGIYRAMIDRLRGHSADIVGLTSSHEYGWHVQSYFLGLKPRALSSWGFQHFIRDIRRIDDKDEVIRTYEVPFTARMRGAGLKIAALYTGLFSANPTYFSWRDLLAQRFPFVKVLMLKREFPSVDAWTPEFEGEFARAGFDLNLLRASARIGEMDSVPMGTDDGLLVDPTPLDLVTDDHRLRVAYFGPWNYDNGLGSASRELLCALRQSGVELNAHPIVKSFHIHRLICPAVPTLDFAGQADVAIVHLNPDSWHLLSDEQRAIIRAAKRRIGYWVWETDTLPPAWQHDLHSVDRIWAPSAYVAEVIEAEAHVPVDVVAHPVRVPARITTDRDTVLRRFGIDPAERVILYIFDGASYLVRKNPEALIRAFAASGLARQGWTLVLKTKHLYDRPEAGKALTALVAETPGARILEVSLHADEVTSLIAAADIYASPHCSEGFGLTVAEAMAVGKPVVATDFSGTRDFLDASCGYPVRAHPWTLEEDHGHYLTGHSWAKIDEADLARQLVRAADAVAKGDHRIAEAATANITRRLSYDAVAAEIRTSLAALIAESREATAAAPTRRIVDPPAPIAFPIDYGDAPVFGTLGAVPGIVPVAVAPDFSCDGIEIPDGDPADWLFIAPRDAIVCTGVLNFPVTASNHRPDVVLFYADDVAREGDPLDRIRLKPDIDRTLLVAQDYVGAPIIIRRKTLTDIGGLDASMGTAALYDVVLRVSQAGGTIGRIPHVLLGFPGARVVAREADRRRALARVVPPGVDLVEGAASGLLGQCWSFPAGDQPRVTIAIPTRQTRHPGSSETYIERLLASIALAEWPMDRLTVIVGDDVPGQPLWAMRPWPFNLVRIDTQRAEGEAFNYAAKMNRLWRAASDEQVIFMNDDAVPSDPRWLAALVGFAIDGSVGGVGARLYYEDGSIQHAGMFPALRTIVHAWLNWPADARTYQDWAVAQREWSVVTGAVFSTRRSILDQVGGFDERFSLEFNDVDLCLRIRNLGYRIVYNPDAQFTHAEKASRGDTIPPGAEVALFLSRWAEWLERDPASHPDFARHRMDPSPAPPRDAWYLAG